MLEKKAAAPGFWGSARVSRAGDCVRNRELFETLFRRDAETSTRRVRSPQKTLLPRASETSKKGIYGGQSKQTAPECSRRVVCGHDLHDVSHLFGRSSQSSEGKRRRDSRVLFEATGKRCGNRGRAAGDGSLPDARDRQRRLTGANIDLL